ncbi:hypothetical protein KR054_010152 [Drosophila jambulina]|nr:hypothetical protein KR054_010152 [Drosophila jambulina]
MLNMEAMQGIFRHHETARVKGSEKCPVELNPAVKNFLSWSNEEGNKDQTVLDEEPKPEKVLSPEEPHKNEVEVAFNFQNLELKPAIESKGDKVLVQNKEVKVQGNGKERIRRTPNRESQGNVKGHKSRLINPKLVDYRQKLVNDKANPYFKNLH